MKAIRKKMPIAAAMAVCITVVWLSGCRTDKRIPFDEQKAKQQVITGTKATLFKRSFREGSIDLGREVKDTNFLDHQFQLPIGEAFNRDAIIALLDANGAQGIRIYLGRDSLGEVTMVLLPIDKDGRDIHTRLVERKDAPTSGATAGGADPSDYQAIDVGQRCPTICN